MLMFELGLRPNPRKVGGVGLGAQTSQRLRQGLLQCLCLRRMQDYGGGRGGRHLRQMRRESMCLSLGLRPQLGDGGIGGGHDGGSFGALRSTTIISILIDWKLRWTSSRMDMIWLWLIIQETEQQEKCIQGFLLKHCIWKPTYWDKIIEAEREMCSMIFQYLMKAIAAKGTVSDDLHWFWMPMRPCNKAWKRLSKWPKPESCVVRSKVILLVYSWAMRRSFKKMDAGNMKHVYIGNNMTIHKWSFS